MKSEQGEGICLFESLHCHLPISWGSGEGRPFTGEGRKALRAQTWRVGSPRKAGVTGTVQAWNWLRTAEISFLPSLMPSNTRRSQTTADYLWRRGRYMEREPSRAVGGRERPKVEGGAEILKKLSGTPTWNTRSHKRSLKPCTGRVLTDHTTTCDSLPDWLDHLSWGPSRRGSTISRLEFYLPQSPEVPWATSSTVGSLQLLCRD